MVFETCRRFCKLCFCFACVSSLCESTHRGCSILCQLSRKAPPSSEASHGGMNLSDILADDVLDLMCHFLSAPIVLLVGMACSCFQVWISRNLVIWHSLCNNLLGPTLVQLHKQHTSRSLVLINMLISHLSIGCSRLGGPAERCAMHTRWFKDCITFPFAQLHIFRHVACAASLCRFFVACKSTNPSE